MIPKFSFHITCNVTETAVVIIDADSIEDAHDIALDPNFYNYAPFCLDEFNHFEVYLPDPDAYEVL
ncbi:hypothetical protein [Microvirga aerophila]|uniref:Uncharacterized protein n=1 Tax=Microvirga aerophila TaxID=670291 RepID=A0A512BVL5_9HYPH|nr:hypothetical protein [Microvirga aerophila]GEO16011.1 hypothetical protein MAE02_37070 [Microvirga aerophila]